MLRKLSKQCMGEPSAPRTYEEGVRDVLESLKQAGIIKEYTLKPSQVSVTPGAEDLALLLENITIGEQ